MNRNAPVAQLDRALPSEGKGHTFESCRVRHKIRCVSSLALDKKSKRPIIAKNNAFAVHIGAKGVVNWVDLEVRLALSRPTGAADYPRLRRDLANVEVARRGATCTSKVDNTA
jgi:hypothetical protein